ncbi:MAG: ABC transporter permease [Deltaproteobacteria bacterium]|nr:ABC transporter permease [Deltaproteobacteria bacterium]
MLSWIGLFKVALSNLVVHKLRSALTVLGIIFGTGAVIATLASNEGASQFIKRELAKLGTNLVTIWTEGPNSITLGERERDLLQKYCSQFESSSMFYHAAEAQARYQAKLASIQLNGVESSYFSALKLDLVGGRTFDRLDDTRSQPLAVIGSQIRKELFGKLNPVGQYIYLYTGELTLSFLVVGTLREKGGQLGQLVDSAVFIPKNTVSKIVPNKSLSSAIIATLVRDDLAADAKLVVRGLLSRRFAEGLHISDAKEAIERTTDIWSKQNMVGICLALVSLLTGGVGIMNIMLLSVTQRRKEIGLRKAVGATNGNILAQFLIEAVVVCLFGGAIGICVGMLFGHQVAQMLGQWEAVITWPTILLALGFASLTGVVFGLLPAVRASRLEPYEALRG